MMKTVSVIVLTLVGISPFNCDKNNSKMTKSSNNLVQLDAWHTIATHGEAIYVGGHEGTLASVSLEAGIQNMVKTDLDIPYLLPQENNVIAVGRWNCSITYWQKNSEKTEQKELLFSGRVNAVSADHSQNYIAGSNKRAPSGYQRNKDKVSLLPSEIYRLDPDRSLHKLEINTTGTISHLLATNSSLIFVQDSEKNTITIVKPNGNRNEIISRSCEVKALSGKDNWLCYATVSQVVEINLNKLESVINTPLPDKFLRILKLIKCENEIFLLTSEGVFTLSSLKKVSKHNGQPSDITAYKEGILILWQDGTVEFYKKGAELITVHLN
ncbi:MAG: hypothetical protein JKY22_08495 [Flavobacteriaceae bacterium]|nr:hypothetical protein [Flavobacteriaceae bacterium]